MLQEILSLQMRENEVKVVELFENLFRTEKKINFEAQQF